MNTPDVDLCVIPETPVGTRLYVDGNKDVYCTVVSHQTVDIEGKEYPLWLAIMALCGIELGHRYKDWERFQIADGRKVGDLWKKHYLVNPDYDYSQSFAENDELDLIKWETYVKTGDAVFDEENDAKGVWVDAARKIVQFEGFEPMTGREWASKTHKFKKSSKWWKSLSNPDLGKKYKEMTRAGLEEIFKGIKSRFAARLGWSK